MDEKLFQEIRDMRDDVTTIKVTIENVATTLDLKLVNFEDKLKVANHRIEDLEDANKWLWRTVVGALIVGVIAYFFK